MYLAVVVLIGPLEASADDLRPAPSGAGQREPSATRTEWMALEVVPLFAFAGGREGESDLARGMVGYMEIHRIATFKWRRFYWTVAELGGGVTTVPNLSFLGYGGTQVGYPIYLGSRGQPQIKVGLGFGGGILMVYKGFLSGDVIEGVGMILSPSIRYTYHRRGVMFYGVSTRAVIPVTGVRYSGALFLFGLDLGFQQQR